MVIRNRKNVRNEKKSISKTQYEQTHTWEQQKQRTNTISIIRNQRKTYKKQGKSTKKKVQRVEHQQHINKKKHVQTQRTSANETAKQQTHNIGESQSRTTTMNTSKQRPHDKYETQQTHRQKH